MSPSALITGGAKRIGREIALALAHRGFNIALHYNTSKNEAEVLASEIESTGMKCVLFQADFLNQVESESLIKNVICTFPDLELLINNASAFEKSSLRDTSPDLFHRQFQINLNTPYFLLRDFSNSCQGHVINILDSRIDNNDHEYCAYTLSKKCLRDLTLIAAKELAPQIRVNAIAPGLILPPLGETEVYLEKSAKSVPMKKKGQIEDILRAVEFLLDQPYVTGQIIYVDGGRHL